MLIPICTSVQAAYYVDIDDAFDYDIRKCEHKFDFENVTTSGQGFEIDGTHFDQGTTVNLNITSFPILSIQYNISVGSVSQLSQYSLFTELIDNNLYLTYPLHLLTTYYNTSDWNSTELSVDPGYKFIPFINNATFTFDYAIEIVENANNQTYLTGPEYALAATNGTYENTSSYFYFEFYTHGIIQDNHTSGSSIFQTNVTVQHIYQYAYDRSDNSLLGSRIRGWIDGFSNDSKLKIEYDFHTELEGYNLPASIFWPNDPDRNGDPVDPIEKYMALVLGLGIGIPVAIILAITITAIVIKKKKKNLE